MQIEQGSVVKGKVTGLTDFGAFVELEGGKTGMIHISEVSTSYVKDIREHLQLNQEVTAKVISISPEGKIALSIKKLNADNNGSDRPQRRPRPSGDRRVSRTDRISSPPASADRLSRADRSKPSIRRLPATSLLRI